jgi:tetratricopeptide (TPR) repeat protein
MGNNSNAEQKFRDALDDVQNTSFPDEEQRDAAMATIYDHMTEFARRTSQFMNTIVYYDAANAVGGINHGSAQHLKCWAYNHLKHYAEGATECQRVLQQSNGNTLLSHYSLARAYEGLEQWDAALAEFNIVADSADNYLRVGAATEMSLIYGSKKHDPAAELTSLNEHPYLFDDRMQPPVDLAVSFNNRCYAYMQLGELERALQDCTASLKYDHIPDAFHKQQELMRRLAGKDKTT